MTESREINIMNAARREAYGACLEHKNHFNSFDFIFGMFIGMMAIFIFIMFVTNGFKEKIETHTVTEACSSLGVDQNNNPFSVCSIVKDEWTDN